MNWNMNWREFEAAAWENIDRYAYTGQHAGLDQGTLTQWFIGKTEQGDLYGASENQYGWHTRRVCVFETEADQQKWLDWIRTAYPAA